ncbi:MAG: hypothetical protein JXB62_23450 [Pirellulales bacterium]|nr:hypothetical protein [Pirellulales bacterium]
MKTARTKTLLLWTLGALLVLRPTAAGAAKLTVELSGSQEVTLLGAVNRFDADGNLRRPVDPKATIDAPAVDFTATRAGRGQWIFADLPPGHYDLLILAAGRVRIEGFRYAPVLEFDPFVAPDAKVDDEVRVFIEEDIKQSRHYENRVEPLYLAGDGKVVRVLVMLIRDQPTSYTPGAGTIRHEIWQYTWKYGAWQKEKRTRVLDRLLLQVSALRRWTWLWDPTLGGIEVGRQPVAIKYQLPGPSAATKLKGLVPY